MASENLNVGTSANANDGDVLRAAFIKVKKMFADIYGQTYSEQGDLSGTDFKVKATQVSTTNTEALSTLDGYVMTYDHSSGGFTFEEYFNGDITRVQGGSGLSGDTQSGEATINIDLNDLTEATLNVANDDIAFVDTSDSNATRKESIADLMSAVAGNGITATNGVLAVSVDTDQIANDAVDGTKLEQFDDSLTAATAGHILVSNGTDFIHTATSGDVTIASGGAMTIGLDKVTHAKLEHRYTASKTDYGTKTANFTIDWSDAAIHKATLGAADLDITFSNYKKGQVIDILLDGDYAFDLTTSETTDTFSKAGSTDYDGSSSTTNIIQVVCIDDDSTPEFIYSVQSYATDANP